MARMNALHATGVDRDVRVGREVEQTAGERLRCPTRISTPMPSAALRATILLPLSSILLAIAACNSSDSTSPPPTPDQIALTDGQVRSLDSTGQVIEQANPTNGTLKSLVDSTLLVLKSGIVLKRLDVATNLTSAPLYFVGIHRVVTRATGGSFSTWNIVAMNDPSNLTSVVEVSGFAPSSGATAPTSVSGTIGDGTGTVNGHFLSVGAAGVVTEWFANTGSASFSSGIAGAACPNFAPTATVTCSLETIHIQFSASASSGSQGASARQAALAIGADVPAMRLTYAF